MSRYCHIYTDEQKQFLANNVPDRSYQELTALFNCAFGLSLNIGRIKSAIKRYGLKNGRDGCFKPGHKSWNKGLKGIRVSPQSEFKKGHMPVNHKPVGTERLSKDGYIEVKVKEPKTWKQKHRIIWEEANGEVPKNHVVLFLDGDKTNLNLDNLLLVSRHELLVANKRGLLYNNSELTKAGTAVAKVIAKTEELRNMKNYNKKAHGCNREQ